MLQFMTSKGRLSVDRLLWLPDLSRSNCFLTPLSLDLFSGSLRRHSFKAEPSSLHEVVGWQSTYLPKQSLPFLFSPFSFDEAALSSFFISSRFFFSAATLSSSTVSLIPCVPFRASNTRSIISFFASSDNAVVAIT